MIGQPAQSSISYTFTYNVRVANGRCQEIERNVSRGGLGYRISGRQFLQNQLIGRRYGFMGHVSRAEQRQTMPEAFERTWQGYGKK
jgi:hypothetical protein